MKSLLSGVALAAAALCTAVPASAAIVLSFTPSSQHVNVGDTVAVDVSIAGLGAEILSGFDLNFLYDGSVLGSSRSADFTSAVNQLGSSPIFVFDTLSLGNWGVQASATDDDVTLAANQADSFLLAQFTFHADADGVSSFGLGPDPDFQRNFVGLNFATLNVDIGSACIAVGTGSCDNGTQVPEPASFGLAGVALLAAGFARRTRRRALAAA